MDDETNNLLGVGSGLAISAYIFAVVWQGNTKELGTMLFKEEPYLEFLIALVIIGLLIKFGPTSKITDLLVIGVIIGLLLRISAKVNLPSVLGQFASGQASMLQTVQTILGGTK